MRPRRTVRLLAAVLAIAAAFAIDQLTKAWALTALGGNTVIELGLGVRLELVFNPGVAFGLGGNLGPPLVIGLIVVSAALATWVLVRAARGDNTLGTTFLALAAGGAVGNVWDRISRATHGPLTGEVVDFIAVDWFAIFNVADIFTTCGIAAWALTALVRPGKAAATHPTSVNPPLDQENR
jgi:signal peptidase II